RAEERVARVRDRVRPVLVRDSVRALSAKHHLESLTGTNVARPSGMKLTNIYAVGTLVSLVCLSPLADASAQSRAPRIDPVTRSASARTSAARPWASPNGVAQLGDAVSSALGGRTRAGEWGAMIVSLTRGDTLFDKNPDSMMQPASTMKMYTSAVALDRFGPDFTFRTPVLRDGQIGPDGALAGNLYLRGVGDPSLSSRFWRDQEPMDVLAKQVAAAGVKRVRGDIIGDATAFEDKLVPDGWTTSYLGAAYAGRVSALSLAENLVWVSVRPDGQRAVVTLEPATTTIPVESSVRVVSGSTGRISASRQVNGTI